MASKRRAVTDATNERPADDGSLQMYGVEQELDFCAHLMRELATEYIKESIIIDVAKMRLMTSVGSSCGSAGAECAMLSPLSARRNCGLA
jgi:L-serine deaminase